MFLSVKQRIKNSLESLFGIEIKNRKRRIPAMISTEERFFLMRCGRVMAGKPGIYVDLGTWLGASTASIAEGILETEIEPANANERIHSFDLFRWEDSMNVEYLSDNAHLDYIPGESFLPETRTYLRDYHGLIKLTEADLTSYQWTGGGIKLLHVDAMKSRLLSQEIAKNFFPSLTHKSILIYQDFKHWYTPWIHVIHYRLKDYFSTYHEVQRGGTVAFRTEQLVSVKKVTSVIDFGNVGKSEVDDAFKHSFSITTETSHPKIAAAHVMYYVHAGCRDQAYSLFSSYSDMGYGNDGDMVKTEAFMSHKFSE